MKSGVQLNFFERRALADRALARLVELAREETGTMSSREQRGIYQLETTFANGASALAPAVRVRIDPVWLERWRACKALVVAVIARAEQVWRDRWSKSTYLRALARSSSKRTFDRDF